jgi:rhodanese-related sulfurtransferase
MLDTLRSTFHIIVEVAKVGITMKIKHLFIFSLVLLLIGIVINVYAYFSKCENVIKRNVNKDIFMGRRIAVYLVNNVQTYCRPCTDYKQLKENDENIVFYVKKDFSDIDIENFRDAFEIRNKDKVIRIIVDIRTLERYKNGHIPASINFEKDIDSIDSLNLSNSNKIIIILTDEFSNKFTEKYYLELVKNGAKNIFVYKKGIEDWIKNGFPIVKSDTLK